VIRLALWLVVVLIGALVPGCKAAPHTTAPSSSGKAGSLARFIVHGDHLYALDGSRLHIYATVSDGVPGLTQLHTMFVQSNPETLFPYGELLFVGTRQGMLVYSLEDPVHPLFIGEARHVYSCDPVVVEDDIAYVTTSSGSACPGGENGLRVFDVTMPARPRELARRPLSRPRGLGVDGDLLFVADADGGLLVLDVSDPYDPVPLSRLPDIAGYDVIADAGILFVVAEDGVYQYLYGPQGVERPLSRIPIEQPAAEASGEHQSTLQR
jgi:hypothetical protein